MAGSLTILAWSGIDYKDAYADAGQYGYLLDAVRWGTDYLLKCHTGPTELYGQVNTHNMTLGSFSICSSFERLEMAMRIMRTGDALRT